MSDPSPDQITAILLAGRAKVEQGITDPLTALAQASLEVQIPYPGVWLWRAGVAALESALPSGTTLTDYAADASLDALMGLFAKAHAAVPTE